MIRYTLVLKNENGRSPAELVVKNAKEPIFPEKGHIILSDYLQEYIANVIEDKKCKEYSDFSFSRFVVSEIEHCPLPEGSGLESQIRVIAKKLSEEE